MDWMRLELWMLVCLEHLHCLKQLHTVYFNKETFFFETKERKFKEQSNFDLYVGWMMLLISSCWSWNCLLVTLFMDNETNWSQGVLKAGNDGKLLVVADYFHCGQNRSQKVGLVISNDRSEMTKYRSLALSLINRQISKLKFCPGHILHSVV